MSVGTCAMRNQSDAFRSEIKMWKAMGMAYLCGALVLHTSLYVSAVPKKTLEVHRATIQWGRPK